MIGQTEQMLWEQRAAGSNPVSPTISPWSAPPIAPDLASPNRHEAAPGGGTVAQNLAHDVPESFREHGACCAALALWVLGQAEMAAAAARICEGEADD